MANKHWSTYFDGVPDHFHISIPLMGVAFVHKACAEGRELFKWSYDGHVVDRPALDELSAKLDGMFKRLATLQDKEDPIRSTWQSEDTAIGLHINERNRVDFDIITLNPEHLAFMKKVVLAAAEEEEEKLGSPIHCLVSTPRGLDVEDVGTVHSPLERGNYTPQVLAGYDRIMADLQSDAPSGRVCIIDGPPGTGKTFLLRGIISELGERGTIILVPPKLVSSIADPSILPTFLTWSDPDDPAILILEDADEVLSPRSAGSIESIASALNLGDGLIGDVLNLRLIATTNVDAKEIDKALLRPGRLSVRMEVGLLSIGQALTILGRLRPDLKIQIPGLPANVSSVYNAQSAKAGMAPINAFVSGGVTLAAVYDLARKIPEE